jgi:hypothetical protein
MSNYDRHHIEVVLLASRMIGVDFFQSPVSKPWCVKDSSIHTAGTCLNLINPKMVGKNINGICLRPYFLNDVDDLDLMRIIHNGVIHNLILTLGFIPIN